MGIPTSRGRGKKKPLENGEVAGRYARYESVRLTALTRARENALLTIPPLVPPEGNSAATKYPTPYQGLGARGTNNLASKLLMALLPPNASFFKLSISDFELEKLTHQKGMRAQVEQAFNQIERAVMEDIETSAIRVKLFEALKQLIVAGNVLLYITDSGAMRVFPMSRYVVKRDPMGHVLEIIVKEDISPLAIPQDTREACDVPVDDDNPEDTSKLYTRIYLDDLGKNFLIYQELNGKKVPGSDGSYPVDECPWMALRFITVENEDYGRSFIEEYRGDLSALEGLRRAIQEGAAAASKILFLIKPNATTNKKKVVESPNGAVIEGNTDDIGVLQLEKYADFRVAAEQVQDLTRDLSMAFLLNSAVQRNGERVTAEEIRYMAGELEDALGGIYSVLSQEFQLPLVRVKLRQMSRAHKLPALPKDLIKPMITTGLEALGRGHDLNKLDTFISQLEPLGPQVIQTYLNVSDYMTRVGTSLGIDMAGLVKTPDQVAQEQQQAQLAQLGQQAAPEVVKGVVQHQLQGSQQNAQ